MVPEFNQVALFILFKSLSFPKPNQTMLFWCLNVTSLVANAQQLKEIHFKKHKIILYEILSLYLSVIRRNVLAVGKMIEGSIIYFECNSNDCPK